MDEHEFQRYHHLVWKPTIWADSKFNLQPMLDRDDYYSMACIGLWNAIKKKNQDGSKFTAYAKQKIRFAIIDGIRKVMDTRNKWLPLQEIKSLDEILENFEREKTDEDRAYRYPLGIIAKNGDIDHFIDNNLIGKLSGTLTQREAKVIHMRYYEDCCFGEIGKQIGVTEARAHQIHAKAMCKLRKKARML